MLVQQTVARSARDRPPPGPWQWSQRWRDLFFAHWHVDDQSLRSLLPPGVELDTWDGMGWISVVAFRLGVRRRWLPPIAPFSDFLEINLRTYVRVRGEPAILFFSLHANSRFVVKVAQWLTPLPYAFAPISYQRVTNGYQLLSRLFQAEFTPYGGAVEVAPDSLDAWLLERYVAYVPDRCGRLRRMVVAHPPWQVQDVVLRSTFNKLGEAWGLRLHRPPDRVHYADGMSALLWPFETVRP
jgi:uncharacterized protein YqjF (DUF2071 family)